MQKRLFFDNLDRKEYFLEQKSELLKICVKNRHGSFQKIELFTMCAFLASQGRKDLFLILWIKK